MRFLVLTFGRIPVLCALCVVAMFTMWVVIGAVVQAVQGPEPVQAVQDPEPVQAVQGPEPIGVHEALQSGGAVVTVYAYCKDHNNPLTSGTFEVLTQAGRPPQFSTGELSGHKAQIVVGPDWIGQVTIVSDPSQHREQTDLIGEPFGWSYRDVILNDC